MLKAVRSVKLVETDGADRESEDDGTDDEMNQSDSTSDTESEVEEVVGLPQFPCVAHTLQLVLKEVDKHASYHNLILKARLMVKRFRTSSVATEKLISKCGKTVVTDCSTRWNSVYFMVSRLMEIKIAVNEVMDEMKWDSLLFNEWSRLAELMSILKPFTEYTNLMQWDNLAMSNVIPSLLELSLHLQDPNLPTMLCRSLLQSLRQRFATCPDPAHASFNPLAALAWLLDPTVSDTMQRDDMAALHKEVKRHLMKMV